MKALLYTDWCSARSGILRYAAVCVLMCVLMCAAGMADETSASAAASNIQQMTIAITGTMMTMMCFYGLFGNDERVGWEAVRLSLPVSRREVVRSRYAFLLLLLAAMVFASAVLGTLAAALATGLTFGTFTLPRIADTLLSIAACILAVLLYSALEMPIFFCWGAAKGRIAFSLPLILVPLLAKSAIRDQVQSLTLSPQAALMAAAPLVLVALIISLVVSERLYERRDF